MAPETHTRYRVQKLIRYGEWLERHADILVALIDVVDEKHTMGIEGDSEDHFYAILGMGDAVSGLNDLAMTLRHRYTVEEFEVEHGKDVTLHQRYAEKDKRWQVVIEAPKPKLQQDDLKEEEKEEKKDGE